MSLHPRCCLLLPLLLLLTLSLLLLRLRCSLHSRSLLLLGPEELLPRLVGRGHAQPLSQQPKGLPKVLLLHHQVHGTCSAVVDVRFVGTSQDLLEDKPHKQIRVQVSLPTQPTNA